MKKLFKMMALALALVSLISLCACGGSDTSLEDVQSKGELVIATSPDFPPFESLDGSEVVGIDLDIFQAICDEMGLELKIEQVDYDSILTGVQSGRYDAGVSGISITPDREENVDFSSPYFLASQAIVVTKDSSITGKADLEGKKISVQTGTTAEEYCMGENYEVLAFQANNDAAAALTSGKVEAWVVDNEVAVAFAADMGLVVLDEAMTSEPYAFAFKKGSTSLVEAVNEVLDKMIADGSVKAIFDKWDALYVSPLSE